MSMGETIAYKQIMFQDIKENHQLKEWFESNYHVKGIHYARLDKNMYVLISGGERPTGGYRVEVDKVVMETPDRAYVSAYVAAPGKGSMVTQVITYPYVLIQIENENIKHVQGALENKQSEKIRKE